jgi:hypothetical protein
MPDACTGNGADFCSGVKVTAALRREDLRRGRGDLGGEQTRRPERKE